MSLLLCLLLTIPSNSVYSANTVARLQVVTPKQTDLDKTELLKQVGIIESRLLKRRDLTAGDIIELGEMLRLTVTEPEELNIDTLKQFLKELQAIEASANGY